MSIMWKHIKRQSRGALKAALLVLLGLCLSTAAALSELVYDGGWGVADWTEEIPEIGINTDADLRMGYVASAGSEINPFVCIDRDLMSLGCLVFESVVELDEQMKPTPLLADSWSVADKTWTFKLREGIVFHNGVSLTAYEVVASYERFRMAGDGNPFYDRLSMIKSMEARDELTLVVESKYSGYVTLYAMTFPVVQSGTTEDSMPRGTGPYWITQSLTGVGIRLEANPLWWKNDAKIHSIAAINYADSGEVLEALMTGEIDLTCTQSSNAAVHRKMSAFTGMDYSTTTYEMLVPNLNNSSPMGDVNLRKAVMYAIDRSGLAENAYLGMAIQCEVPINPGTWLYEPQSAIYYYSPERAMQLLYDAGWQDLTGDGMLNKIDGVMLEDLTLTLITYNESTNSIRLNAANMIAAYLAKVGVKVEVKVYSRSDCLKRIKNREFDLALVGVQLSDVPNLSSLFSSGGTLNLNNFANETMTQSLELVGSIQGEDDLKAEYSKMQMVVVERLPVLGMLFRTGTVLSRYSLGGLNGLRLGNTLNGIEFMSLGEE